MEKVVQIGQCVWNDRPLCMTHATFSYLPQNAPTPFQDLIAITLLQCMLTGEGFLLQLQKEKLLVGSSVLLPYDRDRETPGEV